MQNRSRLYFALVSVIVAGTLIAGGCSGKKVASSSGESSSTIKEKSRAPVETVSPEQMVTVPEERPSSTESARSTFETPSSRGEAATAVPSELAGGESGLGDIFFDFDQYTIRRDAQPVLETNAVLLKKLAAKSVVIEGHCDERGTQAYNLVLGEKRARSTRRYLEDLGVPGSRLKITSFGEMRPFCKERTEPCYQQNRRAHFVVR